MSEIINLDQVEIRYAQNKLFQDGGRVCIIATCDPVGKSITTEPRDDKPGSIYLCEYLDNELDRILSDRKLKYSFSDLFGNPVALSRLLVNQAFGTDFDFFPTKREKKNGWNPEFGDVELYGISYELPSDSDENDGKDG